MSAVLIDGVDLRKLVHDLRGPVVCLKGFHAELEESIDLLHVILEKWHEQESVINHDKLSNVVSEDLIPILKYLSLSIHQLDDRLEILEASSPSTRNTAE